MQTIEINKKEDYVIVKLKRGKVNAINQQMVDELRTTFRQLATDSDVKGVILTGQPHIFSAGLDVIELYGYDKTQIETFFNAFGALHIELVKFEKPLIAAVTGHSPAGGCVLVITCDYKIMAEDDSLGIGLNEVAVNVQISQNLVDAYAFWLGAGLAHQYILDGKLLTPTEALQGGLLNEISPVQEVLPRAEKKMQRYLRANKKIFSNTKRKLRKRWLEGLTEDASEDLQESMEVWWDPEVRMRMKAFVDQLKK